jgi:hypothetical protein
MTLTNLSQSVFTFFVSLLLLGVLAACQTAENDAPPPTLQAAVAGTSYLTMEHTAVVEVLQEQAWGTGQLMLYRWQDGSQTCLAATYLTRLNNDWQAHDTATAPCQSPSAFTAAYTWDSHVHIEAPFGPPRDTVVFGTSSQGRAVRIIWADGQVTHIPVQQGSFLASRAGKWRVERVELLDSNNQILQAEDWSLANLQ